MANKEEKKDAALFKDSEVTGTERRKPGPVEMARRKNNHARDMRTNLGVGKPSVIVVD